MIPLPQDTLKTAQKCISEAERALASGKSVVVGICALCFGVKLFLCGKSIRAVVGRRQYESGAVFPSAIYSAGEKRQRACALYATQPLKGTLHPVCVSAGVPCSHCYVSEGYLTLPRQATTRTAACTAAV